MFRMIGLIVTLAVIGLMYVAMNRSATKAVNENPTVVENGKLLQEATGVDPNDQKAMRDYAMKQARELEAYQNQLQADLAKESQP